MLLLENVRFEPGETKNDPTLAAGARRARATSTSTTPSAPRTARTRRPRASRTASLQSGAGRLLEREVDDARGDPRRPRAAARRGRRRRQGDRQDRRHRPLPRGRRRDPDRRRDVLPVLQGAGPRRRRLAVRGGGRRAGPAGARDGRERRLPPRAARPTSCSATLRRRRAAQRARRRRRARRLDGPRRRRRDGRARTRSEIAGAGTVFWNGPMGAFELEPFAAGTRAVAEAVAGARHDGGRRRRLAPRRCSSSAWPTRSTHLSTGGGASLELLEGKPLPGRGGAVDEPDARPLIAGNWKMHKTIAEAEEFVAALLPRVATADGVDVAICPPFTRARRDGRLDARLARRGLRAEHARGGLRARSPARSRAPMLAELDVARRGARPLRAAPALRRDRRALALKVPAGARGRPAPILCVGETEEEREARRHRAQAAPPGPGGPRRGRRRAARRRRRSPTSRSGRSAPARSPRPSRRRRRAPSCARSSATRSRGGGRARARSSTAAA